MHAKNISFDEDGLAITGRSKAGISDTEKEVRDVLHKTNRGRVLFYDRMSIILFVRMFDRGITTDELCK